MFLREPESLATAVVILRISPISDKVAATHLTHFMETA